MCLPLTARSTCTLGRARCCVLGIILASTIYNIPRFLEVTWVETYDEENGKNITKIQQTKLRENEIYIRYTGCFSYPELKRLNQFHLMHSFMLLIVDLSRVALGISFHGFKTQLESK